MRNDRHIQSLMAMGLNALEAEVYTHLLKESPLTGYGVAKAIGKPAANVYKAIDMLADKGAVIVDEGGTRQCRAVPAKDFLIRLERDFSRHRRDAEDVLSRLPGPGEDTRVYQMRTRDQVFDQCRQMLANATHVVLVDIFPEALVELQNDLAAVAARGVQVVIKTYDDIEVPGAEVIVEPDSSFIRDRWPGQWVDVVVDACRYTLALLTADGHDVVQAVWTTSPFLAYIRHTRIAMELGYTALKSGIERGESTGELARTLERTRDFFAIDAPGYDRLLKQIASVRPAEEEVQS